MKSSVLKIRCRGRIPQNAGFVCHHVIPCHFRGGCVRNLRLPVKSERHRVRHRHDELPLFRPAGLHHLGRQLIPLHKLRVFYVCIQWQEHTGAHRDFDHRKQRALPISIAGQNEQIRAFSGHQLHAQAFQLDFPLGAGSRDVFDRNVRRAALFRRKLENAVHADLGVALDPGRYVIDIHAYPQCIFGNLFRRQRCSAAAFRRGYRSLRFSFAARGLRRALAAFRTAVGIACRRQLGAAGNQQ